MLNVLALLVTAGAAGFVGYRWAMRRARAKAATWFVQPAPPELRARMVDTDPDAPVVLEAAFVRTNLRSSTSDMEL